MATHATNIYITHQNPTQVRGRRGKAMLRAAINKAMGCLSGSEKGSSVTVTASLGGVASTSLLTGCAFACSAGISASGSGAVGMTINGTPATATWATSDTVSAGLVAAAINASTANRIQFLIGATNLKAQVTLVSCVAGNVLTIGGYRFTGISGTTESYKDGEWTTGGTDTADASSLCAAVNRHPYASQYFFALNEAGVCHFFPKSAAFFTGPNIPQNRVTTYASTITVNTATFAASAYYGIWSKVPGVIGNCFTLAASGTGQTIENSNTRMTRGLGPSAEPVTCAL